jgi:Phytochelatin synthase
MPLRARLVLALLLATVQLSGTFAEDAGPANVVHELVPFSSHEGLARLARSTAKIDFPVLANQFEAQSNPAFCGPTSAAIVLNAVRGRSTDLPRDWSRLRAEDLRFRATSIRLSRALHKTTSYPRAKRHGRRYLENL